MTMPSSIKHNQTTWLSKWLINSDKQESHEIASKDDPDSFAVCVMVMDSNHFLIEWMAYHYHVLPMRRIILYVDPNSQTSPLPIIERWEYRMSITAWNASNYLTEHVAKRQYGDFVWRQRIFLADCLRQFKKEGREWVMITDSDEYVMISDRVRNPQDKLSPMNYVPHANIRIPSQKEPGSVLKLIQQEGVLLPYTEEHTKTVACITMPRRNFGTRQAADGINATILGNPYSDFQTFAWHYWGGSTKPGKTFNNVRLVDYTQIHNNLRIHKPFPDEVCKGQVFPIEHESIFVANHYPGSLKQIFFRSNDARASKFGGNVTAYWLDRLNTLSDPNKYNNRDSGLISSWLPGFVECVGEEEAKRLLKNVGDPKLAATTSTSN